MGDGDQLQSLLERLGVVRRGPGRNDQGISQEEPLMSHHGVLPGMGQPPPDQRSPFSAADSEPLMEHNQPLPYMTLRQKRGY